MSGNDGKCRDICREMSGYRILYLNFFLFLSPVWLPWISFEGSSFSDKSKLIFDPKCPILRNDIPNDIAPSQSNEPLIMTPPPDYPFEKVVADYFALLDPGLKKVVPDFLVPKIHI